MGGPEYLPRPGINVKTQSSVGQFQNLGRIAFMAALIAAGAYLTVHVGQIPLSFQEVFICLGGLALGPRRGVLVVLLYLLAGALGLPVFVGGKGGPAAFIGPTGGYMAGFILLGLCAGIGGRLATKGLPDGTDLPAVRLIPALLGCCLGMLPVYAFGAARLMQILQTDLSAALVVGVWPFLPFIPLKLVLAVLLWRTLRRRGLVPQ